MQQSVYDEWRLCPRLHVSLACFPPRRWGTGARGEAPISTLSAGSGILLKSHGAVWGGGWRVGGGLGVSTQATWSLRAAACAWLNSLKPRHPTRWPQYQWWALAYLPPVPAGWSCWCGSDWLGLGYKATTGESPAGGDTGGESVRRSSQSHLWGKYGEETGVFYSFLCWANVIRWL